AISAADIVVKQRRQIHTHEPEERAKIEELGAHIVPALVVIQAKGSDEGDSADEQDVIARNARARVDKPKKLPRDGIVAPHPKQEASRAKVGTHAGTDRCDQEGDGNDHKQPLTSHYAGDMGKGILEVGKRRRRTGPY